MYGTTKGTLDAKTILQHISEYDIFKYYIGHDFVIGGIFSSPLRVDRDFSFGIYHSKYTTYQLMFKDIGRDVAGNCFSFVMEMFGCEYREALEIINNDFRLGLSLKGYSKPSLNVIGVPDKDFDIKSTLKPTVIQIKRRGWNSGVDKTYWSDQYGLSCASLLKYNIHPVTHVWLNGKLIKVESKYSPIYAYCFEGDMYKILSPYSTMKWMTNCTGDLLQGYKQLVPAGDLLIITKSLKDVVVLYEFGYHAVAPHSETMKLKKEVVDNLQSRFKKIVVLYDNDDAGILAADKLCKEYSFMESVQVPLGYKSKDISDLIKDHKVPTAYKVLTEEILQF